MINIKYTTKIINNNKNQYKIIINKINEYKKGVGMIINKQGTTTNKQTTTNTNKQTNKKAN